jgi:hypothetical protein
VVNPRIGSDLQHGREFEEEKPAEVVENHGGGTRMGIGILIPKVGRARSRSVKAGRRRRGQAETGHCGAREQIPQGSRPGAEEPSSSDVTPKGEAEERGAMRQRKRGRNGASELAPRHEGALERRESVSTFGGSNAEEPSGGDASRRRARRVEETQGRADSM